GLHEAKIDAIQNMIDLGLTREQILRKYSPEEYDEALRSMSVKT
ncbi:MAG: flagellar assembly protein H, partial [Solobacterium sp.]|nr:flagellar assembly protein H [Solobacterium sp.]